MVLENCLCNSIFMQLFYIYNLRGPDGYSIFNWADFGCRFLIESCDALRGNNKIYNKLNINRLIYTRYVEKFASLAAYPPGYIQRLAKITHKTRKTFNSFPICSIKNSQLHAHICQRIPYWLRLMEMPRHILIIIMPHSNESKKMQEKNPIHKTTTTTTAKYKTKQKPKLSQFQLLSNFISNFDC